jgi:agmatine deiminase
VAYPVDDGFAMPPEWAPHARCWMQWPCREPLFGKHLAAAREAFADVARAIAEFEPVTMIANPEHVVDASLKCGPGVSTLSLPLDDSWARDSGPTFVINGRSQVAGIDWRWNAWGNKYPDHQRDAAVARSVLDHLGMRRYAAPLVLEGGAIHADGEGTLLTTESCLLNKNRNPDLSRDDVEQLLGRFLGVRKVIWLNGGLEDDDTDGHVDNVACFARPGVVLALGSGDPADGNYAVLSDNMQRLRTATDAAGRPLEVIAIEQPRRRESEDGRRLALSYINFYIANGGVIAPAFEDPQDRHASDTLSKAFPDRRVVQVPATEILYGGGGIHCITQQQPVGEPAK